MGWNPIKRTSKPHNIRAASAQPGRFQADLVLSAEPPAEWWTYFDDPQVFGSLEDRPRQAGNRTIEISFSGPEALKRTVLEIDKRIEHANHQYEDSELPALLEEGRKQADASAEHERALGELRSAADELGPPLE